MSFYLQEIQGRADVISDLLSGEQHILPESTLTLHSRDIQRGEIVKRSLTKPESAVVLETKTEVKLKHCFTGQELDDWVPVDLLAPSIVFERGDRVIYKNWVGTVEAIMEVGISLTPEGKLHWLLDPFCITAVGRKVMVSRRLQSPTQRTHPLSLFFCGREADRWLQDIKQYATDQGVDSNFLGCTCTHHDETDRILRSVPIKVKIKWNAINQKVRSSA